MSTKKQIQIKFDLFCELYNLRTSAERTPDGPEYYSNDHIKLDYNPHYGGYRMDVVEATTGERFFDGMHRRSAKEMLAYLEGLISAKNEFSFRGIEKYTEECYANNRNKE